MCGLAFDNYIFDLYGTLIDIETDESQLGLWKTMSQLYLSVGVRYTPADMRAAYRRIWKTREVEMKKESGMAFPEVDAVGIFRQLGTAGAAAQRTPAVTYKTSASAQGAQAVARGTNAVSGAAVVQGAWDMVRETNAVSGAAVALDATANVSCSISSANEKVEASDSGWYQAAAAIFRILSRKKMRLFPRTLEALAELKRRGARIYLLSNAQHVYTIPEIEQCGLLPYFDGIMISSDEKIRKPQPEYMERLLTRYQLDRTRSVMIGNEPQSDIRVAMACGMHSVLLNTWHWEKERIAREVQEAARAAADREVIIPEVVMSGRIWDMQELAHTNSQRYSRKM